MDAPSAFEPLLLEGGVLGFCPAQVTNATQQAAAVLMNLTSSETARALRRGTRRETARHG